MSHAWDTIHGRARSSTSSLFGDRPGYKLYPGAIPLSSYEIAWKTLLISILSENSEDTKDRSNVRIKSKLALQQIPRDSDRTLNPDESPFRWRFYPTGMIDLRFAIISAMALLCDWKFYADRTLIDAVAPQEWIPIDRPVESSLAFDRGTWPSPIRSAETARCVFLSGGITVGRLWKNNRQ